MITKDSFINYFKSGIKDTNDCGVGIEHEKFVFSKDKRADYKSILNLFEKLYEFGWEPVKENANIISLRKGKKNITLEPGNQIELSGEKLKNIHQTCAESQEYIFELNQSLKRLNLVLISSGFDPISKIEEVPSNPKNRYELMTKIMPLFGKLSLDMMYRTCGTQVNIDYTSEKDFSKKFFVVNRLTPVTIALFANSGIVEKNKSGYLSYRSYAWQNTYRGGLPKIFLENLDFEKYADFILNKPLLFINKGKKVIAGKGKTFQDYMMGNIRDIKNQKPKKKDLEVHLSTIFTELRLKKYIEIRSLDACEWDCHCAGPAFFTGLIYSSLEESLDIIKKWKTNDILNAYIEAPKKGLKTEINNKSIRYWGNVFLKLSKKGLIKRNVINKKKLNETIFLGSVEKILKENKTKAELTIERIKN